MTSTSIYGRVIPFHVIARLLRAGMGIDDLEADAALWLVDIHVAHQKARSGDLDGCCGCGQCWPVAAATRPRYRQFRDRYRTMAKSLGFEGHIAMSAAMAGP